MNKHLVRLSASVLTLALGLSLFTACGKSSGSSGRTIDGSSPWYNVETVIIPDDADISDYEYRYNQFAGFVDDKLVFRTSSSYLSEGQDEASHQEVLSAYDLDGNLVANIELMDRIRSLDLGASVMVYNTEKTNDGIRVIYYVYDEDYNMVGSFESCWNVNTGELSDPVTLESE